MISMFLIYTPPTYSNQYKLILVAYEYLVCIFYTLMKGFQTIYKIGNEGEVWQSYHRFSCIKITSLDSIHNLQFFY